jgi:iron complex transport system substrate-binding protein
MRIILLNVWDDKGNTMIHSALRHTFKRSLSVLACSAALVSAPFAFADAYNVETLYGSITVPDEPQRVVVLDDAALDTALTVGVTPVGTLATRGGTAVPDYLQEKAGDIQIVGAVREPNLEAIFAAEPDLIIATSSTDKALYDKLSQIAPTVVSTYKTGQPWEEGVMFYASALNKGDETTAFDLDTYYILNRFLNQPEQMKDWGLTIVPVSKVLSNAAYEVPHEP